MVREGSSMDINVYIVQVKSLRDKPIVKSRLFGEVFGAPGVRFR